MKIDLEIEVINGKLMLKGKTYDELNDDEKQIMDELLKQEKFKSVAQEL